MRIPTLTNQVGVQAAPNIQQRPLENTAAQSIGGAVQDTGQILFKVQQEERAKEDRATVIEADRLLGEAENELLHTPETGAYSQAGENARGITDKTLSEYDKRVSKIDEGLRNPRQKQVFREAVNERRVRVQQGLQRHEGGQREVAHDNQAQAALDTATESAALNWQDPTRIDQELSRQRTIIGIQAKRKGWSKEELASAIKKSDTATHTAVIGQMLQANKDGPARAYLEAHASELDATQKARIQAVIDTTRVKNVALEISKAFETDALAGQAALKKLDASGLSEEDQIDVRKQVREAQGLLHSERRQEFAEEVNTLERSISAGNPARNAEGQAARLYRKGVYSPGEYTNVLQAIDTARAKGAEDAAEIASIEDAVLNGIRLDPKNDKIVKNVDKWFKASSALNQIKPGSEEWINSAAIIANKTNVLPSAAMAWARSTLLSGEPALTVPAANAMTRWADAAPTAYSYFDDPNLKAYANQVSSLVQAGASPEKAVEITRANMFDIPEQRQKLLQSTYTKEKFADDNAGELQSAMNSDDSFDRKLFGGAPEAPLGMQDEYEKAVRTYFDYTNGNIAKARELAWKDIRGVYGYSTVNGAPQIMKYAPELVFPGIDVNVIRSDVDEVAKSLGVDKPVRLQPSRETGDTNGVLWNLQYTDDDGMVETLLDENNRARKYAIPTDTGVYLKAQEEAKRKAVEDARALSKRQRETAEMDKLVEKAVEIR